MTYKDAKRLKIGQEVSLRSDDTCNAYKIKGIHILPKTVEVLLDDGKWYIHRQLCHVPEIIPCFDFQDFISNISGPVRTVWLNDKT